MVNLKPPPAPAAEEELLRRQHARLRLGIPARLETRDGRQAVRLVDLSKTGAQVVLERDARVREGVLTWLGYETFAMTVWQDAENLGLTFDRALSDGCLSATRERAPEIILEAARAFVSGMDGSSR